MFKYYLNLDEDIPYFSTFCSIIAVLFLNTLTILGIVAIFLKEKIILPIAENPFERLWSLAFIVPAYFLYDSLVVKSGYHDKILEEFKNETPKQKKTSTIYTISYFIFSTVFLFVSLWLRQMFKGY